MNLLFRIHLTAARWARKSSEVSGFVSVYAWSVMNINRQLALWLSPATAHVLAESVPVLKSATEQLCLSLVVKPEMICNVYHLIADSNFIIQHHCRTPPRAPKNCFFLPHKNVIKSAKGRGIFGLTKLRACRWRKKPNVMASRELARIFFVTDYEPRVGAELLISRIGWLEPIDELNYLETSLLINLSVVRARSQGWKVIRSPLSLFQIN